MKINFSRYNIVPRTHISSSAVIPHVRNGMKDRASRKIEFADANCRRVDLLEEPSVTRRFGLVYTRAYRF